MALIGVILISIGLMIFFFAKRIVRGKTKLTPEDEKELLLLMSGAILAMKLAGGVVAVVGLVFMVMGNAIH